MFDHFCISYRNPTCTSPRLPASKLSPAELLVALAADCGFSPRSIPCIGPRGCAILGRKEPPHLPHLQPTVIVQLFNIFQHITSLVAPRKLQPAARVHIRCSTSLTHILRKACQKQKKNQARPLGRQPFYVIATANRAL